MCDYCTKHGAGERWYHNARNTSKDLATSDFVREFCESYFSRDIPPGPPEFTPPPPEDIDDERRRVDNRYSKYLHHQVITTDETIELLKLASFQTDEHEKSVVKIPCICRYVATGSDSDLHCYGISFTEFYTRKHPDYLGGGHEYVSAEEAIRTLNDMVENEAIVHAISALGVPYLGMLCNCEMNVCRPYQHRVKLGIDSPFHKGHYNAHILDQACIGCETCVNVCPFGVPKVNKEDGIAVIDKEACYGCGVCLRNCPENAITLEEARRLTGF